MQTLTKITAILFVIAVLVTLIDLSAIPRSPSVDPWTLYSFISWLLVLVCGSIAIRASVKGTKIRKVLGALILVAIIFMIFDSVQIYAGYKDKAAFQEKIRSELQN